MRRLFTFTFLVVFAFILIAASEPGSRPDREQLLAEKVSNAAFNGRWCLIEKGRQTQEYEDVYFIERAAKTAKGGWVFHARVEYAGRQISVPIPVQVKWAGETPVISLDHVPIPGFGICSARVLIFENAYAGTWSAKGHGGGMLHGVIEKSRNP